MKVQDIKKGGGYLLENKTRLNLPVLGYVEPINLHMRINLFDDYSLKEAFLNLRSESYFLKGELKKNKNNLYSLCLETPLQKLKKPLFIKGELINSLFFPISFNFLPLKKKVTFYVYDPFLEKKMKITLLNKGRRAMRNFKEKTYLVEMDVEGVKGKLYINPQGRLLYEEFLGFKFIKEEPRLLFSKKASSSVDIAQILAIETEKLPEPEKLHYLKVKIRGIKKEWIREDFNQKVIFQKEEAIVEITKRIPAQETFTLSSGNFQKYLKEDRFIRFNAPLLKKTVSSIIKNEKNPLEILKKLSYWINKNIKKVPTFSIPNTLDTLKMRQGDCAEISALLVGFLRCVGIPSYVNIGLVYREGKFFYHAWVSLYVGEWIDTDPALNQLIADPTHIKLFQGLENQFEIFKLLNNLKIDIVEYR